MNFEKNYTKKPSQRKKEIKGKKWENQERIKAFIKKKKSGIGSKIAGHADADYQKNNSYTHQYHDRFLLSI